MTRAANLFGKVPPIAWVLVLAAIVHSPALSGEWLWDDNSLIAKVTLSLGEIWFRPGALAEYYPVTHTTYWVERTLFGNSPFVAHLSNLLIFLGIGYFLFAILKRLNVKGAALGTALFLLHPVNVEAVAWASQRKTLLAGLFGLICVRAYLQFRESGNRSHLFWAIVTFALATLSKTQIVVLVAFLSLLDWWRGTAVVRSDWFRLAPFALIAFGGAITTILMEHRVEPVGEVAALTLVDRFLLMGATFIDSLVHVLSPLRHSLVYEPIGDYVSFGLIGLPLTLLLMAVVVTQRKRYPGLSFVLVGAFLFLLPVSGLIYFPYMAFSPAADRFQFFGNFLVIPGIVSLAMTYFRGRFTSIVLAGWIGVYGGFAFQRSRLFADNEQIWLATVERNPKAWIAQENLGLIAKERGEDGSDRFESAWSLSSDALMSGNEVATMLLASGKEAEGFVMLDKIIAARPKDYQAYVTKGVELMARGSDLQALQALEEGLKQSDAEYHAPLLLNLATLRATSKDPKVRDVMKAEQLALQLVQDFQVTPLHLFCLGDVQGYSKKTDQAIATLEKAIQAAVNAQDPETEARARARIAELESLDR